MMNQENQLPGTGTLEARVTEYHIRKVIKNIFRTTSFFRGGHGANFDVRRRSWRTIEWFDGRMSCVQRGSHRSQPNRVNRANRANRANLKCRGIFATAPKTFTCFRNLKASKGGGSALHRMHLPALARTFCLIKFAIGFLPFNGLRTTIRQPVLEAHETIPGIFRDKP